ncbi:Alpha/beta hydrolase fold-3 [Penicillium paradoxum]|uniref:Alpha/beta hydrolase fold-3 n=1 Tax=Penicillium paradoxum TaxID=176176 RepID=UPI0025492989|nr:Alpha/beta hydrolase fold-3 [Penicillium paradoxum]KAJ5779356.1 Alpha/beta hydrolase fold-3 [Penicillium paradoxum]
MTAWWLGLGIAVGKALGVAIWSAVTVPFRGQKAGASTYKDMAVSFVRTLFDTASLKQVQHVLPSTFAQKGYEAHMKRQKASPRVLHLPGSTTVFWMGDPSGQKLIIYFPGGGYCLPAVPSHFSHIEALCEDIRGYNKTVGVLFLTYDLAPQAQWPRQLGQAVTVLQYAIQALGKRPSDIVLQGDSSGGNLALAILSHIAHPHPQETVPRLSLEEPLGGVLLLSPWVDFSTDYPSYQKNAHRDVISAKSLNGWAQAFLDRTVEDEYNCPVKVPVNWWRHIPVTRIFIGAGEYEVLLDSIKQMAQKMKAEHPDTIVSIAPQEFHVEPITDFALKIPPGSQLKAMASWLDRTFSE